MEKRDRQEDSDPGEAEKRTKLALSTSVSLTVVCPSFVMI